MCMGVLPDSAYGLLVYSARGGKRDHQIPWDSLGMVVYHRVGAGIKPRASSRATSALNCWAIFSDPWVLFFSFGGMVCMYTSKHTAQWVRKGETGEVVYVCNPSYVSVWGRRILISTLFWAMYLGGCNRALLKELRSGVPVAHGRMSVWYAQGLASIFSTPNPPDHNGFFFLPFIPQHPHPSFTPITR